MPEDLSGLISTEYEEQLAVLESCCNIKTARKLLPDLESIRKTIGFCYLVSVEDILSTRKWQIFKVSFSKKKRKILFASLVNLSALQCYDFFKHPQLWKRIFKSLGLRSLLTKKVVGIHNNGRNQRDAKKYARLLLFNFLLCQEKYPQSEEDFTRCQWQLLVAEPLKDLCEDSMFTLLPMENDGENHDDASPWLMPGFQASWRGKKILQAE